MTRWHYLSIAVLLIILVGLLWYSPTPILSDLTQAPTEKLKQYPSAYLTNTKTTQYDNNGKISHMLTASRMRYFDGIYNIADGTVLIDDPLITLFSENSPPESPWIASSLQGKGNQNIDEIVLTGNVVLKQTLNDTFTTMTSELLLIKPEQQYAETDKPVMIKTESGVTTADGLKMSLGDGIIEFPANVRSQYHVR